MTRVYTLPGDTKKLDELWQMSSTRRHECLSNKPSLYLLVAVLSLDASNLLITDCIHVQGDFCLIAGKGNSTPLVTRHAARVEQTSPEEDPITSSLVRIYETP